VTFRRPLKYKWFYPFGVAILLWMGYEGARTTPHSLSIKNNPVVGAVFFAVTAFFVAASSWTMWTSKIVVDNTGVRWSEGEEVGDVPWSKIRSLVLDAGSLGFVVEGTAWTVKLPFVTRKLYEALAQRLNRLTPEEEKVLFR
jgi:hypothetical protein